MSVRDRKKKELLTDSNLLSTGNVAVVAAEVVPKNLRVFAQRMRVWTMGLVGSFGLGLLSQIVLVYFTQGVRNTLCSLGTSYYLKETLELAPSEAEAIRGLSALPWVIKPLYGMISDSLPFCGTRRNSYLILFSLITAFAYTALGIPGFVKSYWEASAYLALASLGIAFCDVVIDGKVVEVSRERRDLGNTNDLASNLQSLSWISLSVGSVLGSVISGFCLNNFGPHGVFLISAVGPTIVIFVSALVHEETVAKVPGTTLFSTIISQSKMLVEVFMQPICWRPVLWLFLSNSIPPSLNEAMFNFKTSELGFSKEFLGYLSTVGSLTLLASTILYNTYFRFTPFKRLFYISQIGSAVISFFELILVSRFNLTIGVGDRFFIFGDEILSDVVARLKHMPALVLCAKICPPGIEGTMFALLMSLYNFSWSVSSYGGSLVCESLNIASDNFSGLVVAVVIRSFLKIIPIFLLFLVPSSIPVVAEEMKSKSLDEQPTEIV